MVRGPISFVIVMLLAGASLEGQAGPRGTQPAKVVKPEAPPAKAHAPAPVVDAHVAPAKPVVQGAVQGAVQPAVQGAAKPAAHAETKPAAQAAATAKPVAPAPAKAPTKSLEEAAESIAAALKARGVRPPSRARAESEPPAPRAPRLKRYALYWPPDDTKWDVQWPVISGRVALTWGDTLESSNQPASD
jgi:hypothetical protein